MLSDTALASFQVVQGYIPDLRDDDKEYVENYINAASLRIRDFLGHNIIRASYEEVYDFRRELKLKHPYVKSITEVLYDPAHKFDDDATELVADEDYFWFNNSAYINFSGHYLIVRDAVKVTYTAGLYPLIYVDNTEPSDPSEGEVWKDTDNSLLKLYNGSSWDTVSESDVIDSLCIQALVETMLYYKKRIYSGGVGSRSTQGSSKMSFYQQMELELPQNVKDMLSGQGSLL